MYLEIVGGNQDGVFWLHPETGMLHTARPLDAETKSSYALTVSALDQGNAGARKQSSARVQVRTIVSPFRRSLGRKPYLARGDVTFTALQSH